MTRQRCHVGYLKVECRYPTLLSLTNILVTKQKPTKVSVSVNAKMSSTQAIGPANTRITGKKHKSEPVPQLGALTPTQDAEQAPAPPPKKKMKASVEPSQPSSTTTATERNHGILSKTKKTDDHSATKCPIHDEFDSDGVSVGANPAHPAKKAKVNKFSALTGLGVPVPIHCSGKIFPIF
jgi:hypothetical protein